MNAEPNGPKRVLNIALLASVLAATVACGPKSAEEGGGGAPAKGDRIFISIGTAPVGGVFFTFGGAVSDVVAANSADLNWRMTAESTGGSMENIRRLESGDIQFAISNSSISYFAARGEGGWEKAYPIQAVMTLFPNVAMFVTKIDSGITTPRDLKGKRVAVGPEGAGFEYFIRPLLEAHGVTYDDFEDVYAGQQSAADLLGDGSINAAFLGGAVPTGSITSAATTMDILLVPYGDAEMAELLAKYPFFGPATIPANTYKGQSEDYNGLNVGSAHLITSAGADEETIYRFTKILYENRAQVVERHGAGRAINEKNVVRNTGIDFHPGAIRYYKEIGIWPQADSGSDSESEADTESGTESDAEGNAESGETAADPNPLP